MPSPAGRDRVRGASRSRQGRKRGAADRPSATSTQPRVITATVPVKWTIKRQGIRSRRAEDPIAVTSDPYRLRPEDVVDPPHGLVPTLRRIGPGMVLAASIVGSGELIATTTLGAQVGYAALWVLLDGTQRNFIMPVPYAGGMEPNDARRIQTRPVPFVNSKMQTPRTALRTEGPADLGNVDAPYGLWTRGVCPGAS